MKYVWYVQDCTSYRITEVYTTKQAAFAAAEKIWGSNGIFQRIDNCAYYYKSHTENLNCYCYIEKVPVIHAKRK